MNDTFWDADTFIGLFGVAFIAVTSFGQYLGFI